MENALKMGFQISHLWWAMSTRGFNIMGKTVNLIRGGLSWVHHILWSNVIPSHSPSMVQTDLKHFWSPGREEDPSCPASEHILAQGRGIKSVMNHTLNASNPFYVHTNTASPTAVSWGSHSLNNHELSSKPLFSGASGPAADPWVTEYDWNPEAKDLLLLLCVMAKVTYLLWWTQLRNKPT